MKEHKHADVIRAFADGKAIQYFDSDENRWKDITRPSFIDDVKYRIKPEEFKWQKEKDHWEKGGDLQYFCPKQKYWFDLLNNKTFAPNWHETVFEWRIKPIAILDEETQNAINEVLDCMDFEKVKKVMDFLNWTWWNTNGVPEIYELRIFAREQLNRVAKDLIKSGKNRYSTSCGGFVAEAERDDDDSKIYFNLSFVLTNWSNWE